MREMVFHSAGRDVKKSVPPLFSFFVCWKGEKNGRSGLQDRWDSPTKDRRKRERKDFFDRGQLTSLGYKREKAQ